jgi:hypothetical protein
MHIKEYPQISQDGKTVLESTSTRDIVNDFCGQLSRRGKTFFGFHLDKSKIKETEDYDAFAGISFSEDFDTQDMMTMIMGYLDSTMTTSSKLAFVTQMQNFILTDVVEEQEDEYDEE